MSHFVFNHRKCFLVSDQLLLLLNFQQFIFRLHFRNEVEQWEIYVWELLFKHMIWLVVATSGVEWLTKTYRLSWLFNGAPDLLPPVLTLISWLWYFAIQHALKFMQINRVSIPTLDLLLNNIVHFPLVCLVFNVALFLFIYDDFGSSIYVSTWHALDGNIMVLFLIVLVFHRLFTWFIISTTATSTTFVVCFRNVVIVFWWVFRLGLQLNFAIILFLFS